MPTPLAPPCLALCCARPELAGRAGQGSKVPSSGLHASHHSIPVTQTLHPATPLHQINFHGDHAKQKQTKNTSPWLLLRSPAVCDVAGSLPLKHCSSHWLSQDSASCDFCPMIPQASTPQGIVIPPWLPGSLDFSKACLWPLLSHPYLHPN